MEKEYGKNEAMKCVNEKKEETDEGGGHEHTVKLTKMVTILILTPVTVGHISWDH
jgi:hypothetical protein